MKKLKEDFKLKPFVYKLPPMTLYYDDIENIIDIIKKSSFEYIISDNEYEYETLDELKQNYNDIVTGIKIEVLGNNSSREILSINFQRGCILLQGYNLSQLIELWHIVKQLLIARCPLYKRIMFSWVFYPFALLISTCTVPLLLNDLGLATLIDNFPKSIRKVIAIILLLIAISPCVPFFYRLLKSKIYLDRRSKVKNFLSNYKREIIWLLISSPIIYLLGKIFRLLA